MRTAIRIRSALIFIAALTALSEIAISEAVDSETADAHIATSAVEACLKKAREIKAYRYTYELSYSNPTTRHESLQRLAGTVVVPDKLYLTEPPSNAGGETIVIGDRHYYRNSPSDSWRETPLGSDLRKMVHPMERAMDVLKEQKATSWTHDPSKNQLKLEYKRQLELDIDSELEIVIDSNKGHVLEVKAKARGSYSPTLNIEGWEQTEVWSFYDINDPGIAISIPRLTKK